MKKVTTFLNCLGFVIKKKFFKGLNNDIPHACVDLTETANEVNSIEELKLTEDYAIKYNTTTRWQTL
jgi:hypothetical protein